MIYLDKFLITDESPKSDSEIIITYFTCLFGDQLTYEQVSQFKQLDEHCDYNGYTKEFVLVTISNHIKTN